jgi:hypothetical protein
MPNTRRQHLGGTLRTNGTANRLPNIQPPRNRYEKNAQRMHVCIDIATNRNVHRLRYLKAHVCNASYRAASVTLKPKLAGACHWQAASGCNLGVGLPDAGSRAVRVVAGSGASTVTASEGRRRPPAVANSAHPLCGNLCGTVACRRTGRQEVGDGTRAAAASLSGPPRAIWLKHQATNDVGRGPMWHEMIPQLTTGTAGARTTQRQRHRELRCQNPCDPSPTPAPQL